MPKRRPIATRIAALAAGLFAGLVLLLAVEGGVTLWRGRPLLRRMVDPSARLLDGWDDAQRSRLAQATAGPFDVDTDPEVGHRVKSDSSFSWHGVPAHTDAFGMRVRPAGRPGAGTRPIVVLGDSIAFGLGVADDETYAARLEAHLAGCWSGTGEAPPVMTVAAPGWNLEASTRWMRNHLDRYDPSLVVLLPVDNDLENRFLPTGSGGRNYGVDPVHGAGRVPVSSEAYTDLRVAMSGRAPLDAVAAVLRDGGLLAVEHALTAGLAPESRRRLDEAVDAVLALRDQLAHRSARLAVMCTWDSHFMRELEVRLRARAPDLVVGFVFDEWRITDALVGDGHPNPRCIDAGAGRMLAELGRHGLLPTQADSTRLTTLPAEFSGRLAHERTGTEAAAWLAERRALLEKHSGPVVDLRDGRGFQQIYAGVEPDGTIGRFAEFCLRRAGGERSVELLLDRPAGGIAPRNLRVRLAWRTEPGEFAGRTEWADAERLFAGGALPGALRLELPPAARGKGWIDLRLETSDHLVETVAQRSRVASLRLVSATLAD